MPRAIRERTCISWIFWVLFFDDSTVDSQLISNCILRPVNPTGLPQDDQTLSLVNTHCKTLLIIRPYVKLYS